MTRPFYVNPDGSLDPSMSDMQARVEQARVDVVRSAMLEQGPANLATFDKDENGNERHVVEVNLSAAELLGTLGMADCHYREHYDATTGNGNISRTGGITRENISFEAGLQAMQVISGITAAIRKAQDEGHLPKSIA